MNAQVPVDECVSAGARPVDNSPMALFCPRWFREISPPAHSHASGPHAGHAAETLMKRECIQYPGRSPYYFLFRALCIPPLIINCHLVT
jgi:hypothetical protein